MLFRRRLWPGIADGSVTVAFRRWRRPSVKAGGTLKTPVGLLAIDEVAAIDVDDITDADAVRAGHVSRQAVLGDLARHADGQLYRIEFHHAGDDPRLALGDDDDLDDEALGQVRARLDRLDRASAAGPWTRETLRLIDRHPETVARELAAMVGRERDAFKRDVRKLKELGLTRSLPVGYRLSPRGAAVLRALD